MIVWEELSGLLREKWRSWFLWISVGSLGSGIIIALLFYYYKNRIPPIPPIKALEGLPIDQWESTYRAYKASKLANSSFA